VNHYRTNESRCAVVFAGKELLERANLELIAEGKEPLLIEGV
jgi:hypothetical protein